MEEATHRFLIRDVGGYDLDVIFTQLGSEIRKAISTPAGQHNLGAALPQHPSEALAKA